MWNHVTQGMGRFRNERVGNAQGREVCEANASLFTFMVVLRMWLHSRCYCQSIGAVAQPFLVDEWATKWRTISNSGISSSAEFRMLGPNTDMGKLSHHTEFEHGVPIFIATQHFLIQSTYNFKNARRGGLKHYIYFYSQKLQVGPVDVACRDRFFKKIYDELTPVFALQINNPTCTFLKFNLQRWK